MDSKMKVENLDLYYGKFKALKNINLDLPKNEITAFIGPSGCGKSTLLKSLNRMNDLVEGCKITGKVTLDGDDIYGDMDVNLLRKRVGMVFQKPNPFPMSIYDNIAYGPRTHGIRSKAKLDDIVEKSLRNAAIWDELKARLKKSALGLSGEMCIRDSCLSVAGGFAIKQKITTKASDHSFEVNGMNVSIQQCEGKSEEIMEEDLDETISNEVMADVYKRQIQHTIVIRN